MTDGCVDILRKWIEVYLERNNLILMEIDWGSGCVTCYKDGTDMFEDYLSFTYTEVDLFK